MAVRDSGWIQLFAETNQEAADLHVQAFRLAEELSLPVMVCMDGFILTHAVEGIDVPEQAAVDAFLPPFEPRQVLDPDDPVSIGAMVGPEAFEEVRYLAHLRQLDALELIPAVAAEFAGQFGRPSGGLVRSYRTEDADTVVVALGSVLGTIKDAVDARRDAGERVGVVGITSFRPFPRQAVRDALVGRATGRRGREGVQCRVRRRALDRRRHGHPSSRSPRSTRWSPVSAAVRSPGARSRTMLAAAAEDRLEPLTFLDLDHGVVEREQARMAATPTRPGPTAENVLRDLGTVASRIG